jgi:hypothetical protein
MYFIIGIIRQPVLTLIKYAAFISAATLMLAVLRNKQVGDATGPDAYMKDVRKCLDLLKINESRFLSSAAYVYVIPHYF